MGFVKEGGGLPKSVVHLNRSVLAQTCDLLGHETEFLVDDGLELGDADAGEHRAETLAQFAVENGVAFGEEGVWRIVRRVVVGILGEGRCLVIDDFVSVGVGDVELVGSDTEGGRFYPVSCASQSVEESILYRSCWTARVRSANPLGAMSENHPSEILAFQGPENCASGWKYTR